MNYSLNYYYHVTLQDWPAKIRLRPRLSGENRSPSEPNIKRICVAPTMAQCIVALDRTMLNGPIKFYRTREKVIVSEPYGISDVHITNEKWLTKPTTFIKHLELNDEQINRVLELAPESSGHTFAFPHQIVALKLLSDLDFLRGEPIDFEPMKPYNSVMVVN